jgi:hypothetical protein
MLFVQMLEVVLLLTYFLKFILLSYFIFLIPIPRNSGVYIELTTSNFSCRCGLCAIITS